VLELIAWGFLVLMLAVIVGACVAAALLWLAVRALHSKPPTEPNEEE
jgi:hypothetical protein